MRDPYDVLGLKRDASFAEIKAAFRRLSKERHPDHGGSDEAMSELNVAHQTIIDEVKRESQREQEREAQERTAREAETEWRTADHDSAQNARREQHWRDRYREIDEELEALRRATQEQEERLRRMREEAWSAGARGDWARLTIADLLAFVRTLTRSGVKGLALLFAGLVGIGTILVEANVVSAVIMIGSLIGVLISLAFKSPKVGMMTGGVLALYVLITIFNTMSQRASAPIAEIPTWTPQPEAQPRLSPPPRPTFQPPPPPPPEPLTLLASDGAILKFAAGVPYRLKVRTGRTTDLEAASGTVRAENGADASHPCLDSLHFLPRSAAGPWRDIDATYRACGGDAVMKVHSGT